MRILVLITCGFFITACRGTNPYGLTTTSMGESVVSSATGQAGIALLPLKGLNMFVHPDRLLRDEEHVLK